MTTSQNQTISNRLSNIFKGNIYFNPKIAIEAVRIGIVNLMKRFVFKKTVENMKCTIKTVGIMAIDIPSSLLPVNKINAVVVIIGTIKQSPARIR